MAFNHNGDTKPAAGKAAAGKTAAKKKAGRRSQDSSEDVTEKSSAKKKAAKKKPAKKKARVAKKAPDSSAPEKSQPAGRGRSRRAARGENVSISERQGRTGEALEDPMEAAKQTMKGSVPAIVEAMVKKAKQGSCSHAKTVLEMTGAKHMFGAEAEAQESGEPWAKLVLERMEQAEQESLRQGPPEIEAES